MGADTKIEWTDATWNPVVGCSVTSPGCTNCYAMRMAARVERMLPPERRGDALLPSQYAALTKPSAAGPVWTGRVNIAPAHLLTAPLRWRKPRRIFVNSMGDLFHKAVPDEWIDRVFAVMALAPKHNFQVLTKRAARMRDYLSAPEFRSRIIRALCTIGKDHDETDGQSRRRGMSAAGIIGWNAWAAAKNLESGDPRARPTLPLVNVWLGVSTEDQQRANERIPDLLATPAAVRFVSAEPLLGPVNLNRIQVAGRGWQDVLQGWRDCSDYPGREERLNLVIAGGESGPGARPMHPDWARSLRDQCAAAGVAYFHKQNGEWETAIDRDHNDPDWRCDYACAYADDGKTRWLNLDGGRGFHGERFHVMRRVGKARAGRMLDGRTHDELPEASR